MTDILLFLHHSHIFLALAAVLASIVGCTSGKDRGAQTDESNKRGAVQQKPAATTPLVVLSYATDPKAPSTAMGISGLLEKVNGCLAIRSSNQSYVLYLPRGTFSWNDAAQQLTVGDLNVAIEQPVNVRGRALNSVGPWSTYDAMGRCGDGPVFVVAPGGLSTGS
jgi:hypothetical protein